jgi:hypothetical protein
MPFLAWLLAGLVCFAPALARAGSLQDVEDAARPSHDDDDDDDDRDQSAHHHGGGGDGIYVSGGDSSSSDQSEEPTLLELIVLAPWALPRLLIDDPCLLGYAAYPYRDGVGQLRRVAVTPECAGSEAHPLPESSAFALSSDFEASYVLHDIVAGTFAARLQMPYRLELAGRISFLEDLSAKPREQALSGSTHLNLRFAQSASVQFRSGLGLRAFSLHKPLYGVDFFYGMDVSAHKPMLVHLELHAGSLGHAFAAQARATIGVQLRMFEIYAGYDHTVVYGPSTARLGGPVLGLRVWF